MNEFRFRDNFRKGTLDSNLAIGNTTLVSAMLVNFPSIDTSQHAALILNTEVVWITAHTGTSNTATVLRGQEYTTQVDHAAGDTVIHGPTVYDFWLADNVKVFPTNPYLNAPGIWIQTGLGGGSDFAFYFEDGT